MQLEQWILPLVSTTHLPVLRSGCPNASIAISNASPISVTLQIGFPDVMYDLTACILFNASSVVILSTSHISTAVGTVVPSFTSLPMTFGTAYSMVMLSDIWSFVCLYPLPLLPLILRYRLPCFFSISTFITLRFWLKLLEWSEHTLFTVLFWLYGWHILNNAYAVMYSTLYLIMSIPMVSQLNQRINRRLSAYKVIHLSSFLQNCKIHQAA